MESSLSCHGDNQSSIEIRGEVRITTTGLCWTERSRKWLNKSQRDTIENCGRRVGEKCRIKYNITCLVDISQVWRQHKWKFVTWENLPTDDNVEGFGSVLWDGVSACALIGRMRPLSARRRF